MVKCSTNVLEERYNSMPRRIVDLIKATGDATKYQLYDVGEQCCVFIEMYLKYVVVFFVEFYLEFIFKCCLIIRFYDL